MNYKFKIKFYALFLLRLIRIIKSKYRKRILLKKKTLTTTLNLKKSLQQVMMAENPPGMGFPIMHPAKVVTGAFVFGFCANLCFCLGLYTEVVITALGFPLSTRRIRYFLFGLGLMISLGGIMLVWFMLELSSRFPAPP